MGSGVNMFKPSFIRSRVVEVQNSSDSEMAWFVYSGGGSPAGPNTTGFVIGSLGNVVWSGVILKNVNIPQGATIDSAIITLMSASAHAELTVNANLYMEDTDNAAEFTDYANYFARPVTTAYVAMNNIAPWAEHEIITLPDMKAPVQEVVARPAWSPGGNMCFMVRDNGSTQTPAAYRYVAFFTHIPFGPLKIRIEYH